MQDANPLAHMMLNGLSPITDENHRAVEKTIAATERKSGKKMKRLNPMTNFPVSTNNVIHAPDLILP